MGVGLKLLTADLERALRLPKGAVTSVGLLDKPAPKVNISAAFGERMIVCGVARGLTAPEMAETVD